MTERTDRYALTSAAAAPAFSVDGRTVFHLRGAGMAGLWAMGVDGTAARPVAVPAEKVAFIRRAPGDDRLLFGTDAGGDERQQLWLAEAGGVTALTASLGAVHDFGAWSPDGTAIAYAANDRDEAHFDVLVQTLGEAPRRLFQGTHQVAVTAWHPDGDRLVVIADEAEGDQALSILRLDGTMQPVPHGRPMAFRSVRWSKDGAQLLALSDGGGEFLALCRVGPEDGSVTPWVAAEGMDVEAWALSPDGLTLATVENDRGYGRLRVGPVDGERQLVAGLPEGVVSDLAWSPDGSTLAFAASSPQEPPSLWLLDRGAARPVAPPLPVGEGRGEGSAGPIGASDVSRGGTLTPALSQGERERNGVLRVLWRPEAPAARPFGLVSWPAQDGRVTPGWFARPDGTAPAAGWPAVVWVHGGPAGQTRANWRPDMQMLLDAGFAVLMPNVRGSTGYGRSATASDDVGLRLDSVHDLAAAHRWLVAQPGIDAGRIGVMGQSYGGYMVLAAITEYPALWRAAVDYYGIADFTTLLAETGPWRRAHRSREYGDPQQDAALFARISPLHRADRITAPLLVLHGTRDPRVPYRESEQIVAALRARNHPVMFETFGYAGHGFIRPEDRCRAYHAVARFFTARL